MGSQILRVGLRVIAAAIMVAACASADDAALNGVTRQPALSVGDVVLPSGEGGSPQAMQADPNELLVVYFGYTSCPDICPTTMSDIGHALDQLSGSNADRVRVAFATVDPDRDTVAVIENYLDHFVGRGVALRTEDPELLSAAAARFGVQFAVAEHEADDLYYEVAHTAVTYVVDDTGTVAVEWPFGISREAIAGDLALLLGKESK